MKFKQTGRFEDYIKVEKVRLIKGSNDFYLNNDSMVNGLCRLLEGDNKDYVAIVNVGGYLDIETPAGTICTLLDPNHIYGWITPEDDEKFVDINEPVKPIKTIETISKGGIIL